MDGGMWDRFIYSGNKALEPRGENRDADKFGDGNTLE
jgi:hypothetical protein